MSVLVDTSVWAIALRRDGPPPSRELEALRAAIEGGNVCLLGLILQEVLQGFPSLDRTRRLVEHLSPFPLLSMHRGDYVYAAEIRTRCRAKGLAISSIDAQIAAAAINHRCALLTLDRDFTAVARHFPLRFA
jgi:predicted nucleic acid-binding protein